MKLLASLALLAFVTWALHAWVGLFADENVALALAVVAALLIAFIYDRRQASRR